MALPTFEELLGEDIFTLLGIPDAPDEKKAEILETMTTTLDARVVNRVASALSEEDAKRFNDLAEHGDKQVLVDFLVDQNIDLPLIVSEEATRLRVEIVELSQLALEK